MQFLPKIRDIYCAKTAKITQLTAKLLLKTDWGRGLTAY